MCAVEWDGTFTAYSHDARFESNLINSKCDHSFIGAVNEVAMLFDKL